MIGYCVESIPIKIASGTQVKRKGKTAEAATQADRNKHKNLEDSFRLAQRVSGDPRGSVPRGMAGPKSSDFHWPRAESGPAVLFLTRVTQRSSSLILLPPPAHSAALVATYTFVDTSYILPLIHENERTRYVTHHRLKHV